MKNADAATPEPDPGPLPGTPLTQILQACASGSRQLGRRAAPRQRQWNPHPLLHPLRLPHASQHSLRKTDGNRFTARGCMGLDISQTGKQTFFRSPRTEPHVIVDLDTSHYHRKNAPPLQPPGHCSYLSPESGR